MQRKYTITPALGAARLAIAHHHWPRELQALGHTVRLMPPANVKPYVKQHKNDALMLWTAPPPARKCHRCGRC
jgi:transposase